MRFTFIYSNLHISSLLVQNKNIWVIKMWFKLIYSKVNRSSSLIQKSISEYHKEIYFHFLKVTYKFLPNWKKKYIWVIKMEFTFIYLKLHICSSLIQTKYIWVIKMGFTFIYSKLNISSSLIHKSISELSKCNLHYFTKRYILVPLSSKKVYLSYENGIYIYILKVKYKFLSNP